MGRNFQGVSKVNDKNETKTVNLICNPNKASCKFMPIINRPEQEISTQNGNLGLSDYEIPEKTCGL